MFWIDSEKSAELKRLLRTQPMATASLIGDEEHGSINGIVSFYPTSTGTLLSVDVSGLPVEEGECSGKFFAIHIHEGSECTGDNSDPFSAAGACYNPYNCHYPEDAGDLVPIFTTNGFAWGAFYTENFKTIEIIGKTFMIHEFPSDLIIRSNASLGNGIACGVIRHRNDPET